MRRRRAAEPVSDEPEPWRVRAARQYGYTLDDLRRVRDELNVWPTDEQLRLAAARRVAAVLNRRD